VSAQYLPGICQVTFTAKSPYTGSAQYVQHIEPPRLRKHHYMLIFIQVDIYLLNIDIYLLNIDIYLLNIDIYPTEILPSFKQTTSD